MSKLQRVMWAWRGCGWPLCAVAALLGLAACELPPDSPAASALSSDPQPHAEPIILDDFLRNAFKVYPHGVVFIFVMHDCPIANSYAPEIARLIDEYRNRGFGFTLVYVDDELTLADVRKHAAEYGIKCDVLTDPDHALVRKYGASISPEAALVSAHNEILYLGRIDDRYVGFGKRRAEPSRRDLRDALDAVLAGDPVPNPRMPAVGCYITPQS